MSTVFDATKFSQGVDIFGLSIPVLAIDIVLFTIYQDRLSVILTTRTEDPLRGRYVLPGGIVQRGYTLEENFDDILARRMNIRGIYKEQLYTFGDPMRDPRGHVISVSYYALVGTRAFLEQADLRRICIVPYDDCREEDFAFDHLAIIRYAHQRLRYKLEYTNIAQNILPDTFTLTALQSVYESILGEAFDKRNFRKKILSLDIVEETGEMDTSSNRPARLYRFRERDLRIVEVISPRAG